MINKKQIAAVIRSGKERTDAFNAKYQCNLSLNDFVNKIIKQEKQGNPNAWNDVYQSTFGEIYQKVASDMIRTTAAQTDSCKNVLEDFERDVMAWFSSSCEHLGVQTNAAPYGGMDPVQRSQLMSDKLAELTGTYVGLSTNQYSNGQTRIRDMVSFAREAIGGDIKHNVEAQKRIMGNVLALERINNSRSGFWRVIHPFRNKAEQRDAELMRQMLREAIGQKAYQDAEEGALDNIDSYQKVSDQLQEDIEDLNNFMNDEEKDEPDYDRDSELDFSVDEDLDYDVNDSKSYDSSFREPIHVDDDEPQDYIANNFISDKDSEKARLERFKKENEQYLKRP